LNECVYFLFLDNFNLV